MKIVRIDVTDLTVHTEEEPEELARLGGRGLIARVAGREIDPRCHPLGPNNKLIVACGLLNGTGVSSGGRLSIGAKSPLTEGIKESNTGGDFGNRLARLGFKALIVEGFPRDGTWHYVLIDRSGVRLQPADDLAGLGTYETTRHLLERHGERCSVLSIGQAGEARLPAACLCCTDLHGEPTREAARGGLGAVMGAKRMKAVVVDAEGADPASLVAELARFKEAREQFHEILRASPATSKEMPKYGTAATLEKMNALGGLGTRNFRTGRFERADEINGLRLYEILAERGVATRYPCMRPCLIRCANVYHDTKGRKVTGGFEFETIFSFGANCAIADFDRLASLNRRCDDYGVDSIETGGALAILMEAGFLSFGDGERAEAIVEEIGRLTPLGRLVASGAVAAARAFGLWRVPAVKGQSLPAYDPRFLKGTGVTYATSPMGADHTAGMVHVGQGYEHLSPKGQSAPAIANQRRMAVLDTAGLCAFGGMVIKDKPEILLTLINARLGEEVYQDVQESGEAILREEREFNRRAGFSPADDDLPEFFRVEDLPEHGTVFDVDRDELQKINWPEKA